MERKIPLRMCVICKSMVEKNKLTRVVKTPEGEIRVDGTGKANGRGAYICADCMPKLMKTRALNRAFKTNVLDEVYSQVLGEYEGKNN